MNFESRSFLQITGKPAPVLSNAGAKRDWKENARCCAGTCLIIFSEGGFQKVPRPVCICFYNGRREQAERQVLKLSDAYNGEGDIEVRVAMLNINYGKNRELMEACDPLKEYAWLVDAVRTRQSEKMDLDAAVDAALDKMPDEYVIKPFLLENRAEVKNMFLTEYNEEKIMEKERQEGGKNAMALTNWLWRNGRGEDAEKAADDVNVFNRLFAEFIAKTSTN